MFLQNKKQKINNSKISLICRDGWKNIVSTLLFLCFFTFASNVWAQYSVSGDNSSELLYRQIKTNRFRIVYPDFYEDNAQKLARVLDTITPIIGNSLNTKTPLVPILIHTRSSKSNGLTVWAPKRMEFWTTTSPDSYAYPFSWQLALHEYRHSCQMQGLNVGMTKTLSTIFGEHILGAVVGLFIPYWFMEGDAVVAETALAPTGRGQTPDFNMYLKAQVIDKGRYTSDKMKLGSMKDFVPDEYNLGYFLVAYGREKYGKNIWGDCLNDIGASWWKMHSWGTVKKKNIKISFDKLYNETIDSLEMKWIDEDIAFTKNDTIKELKQWTKRDKHYCSYKNPIQINDSTILALKTSNFQTQELVMITNKTEKTLLHLPYLLHSYFAFKNNKILYSQNSPHPRWQQETSADIIEYDLKTNTFRTITNNATFFTPIYNPKDSSLIASILTDDLDNQKLTIISPNADFFKNKNFIKKNNSVYIKSISDIFTTTFSYPAWSDDGKNIFTIETTDKGKAIVKYNIHSEKKDIVIPYSFDNIKYLQIFNGRLFFVKDVNNKYQLLSVNLNNFNDVQIHTNSRFGIDNFYLYDSTIVISDYTANGYKIKSFPYYSQQWNINTTSPEFHITKVIRQQESFTLNNDVIKDTIFNSSRYWKFLHLFKFHSWAPVYININKQELGQGISVFSQNLLSSSVLELGYRMNFFDKNEVFMRYTYSGFYPVFELETSFKPRDVLKDLDSNIIKYANWNELMSGLTIKLPFVWTNRSFRNELTSELFYSLHNISNDDNKIPLTLFSSVGFGINASNYSAMAKNDLNPRMGHITNFKFLSTLTAPKSFMIAVSSKIFIPTPFVNQSLVVQTSFQKNSPNVYYFPNEVPFVRGVYNKYPKYFEGILISYDAPIAYPDLGIPNIIYFKRFVVRPFFNCGWYDKDYYDSYGSDLESKINVFGITIPLNVGVRFGYCEQTKNYFASFLFSIDF